MKADKLDCFSLLLVLLAGILKFFFFTMSTQPYSLPFCFCHELKLSLWVSNSTSLFLCSLFGN